MHSRRLQVPEQEQILHQGDFLKDPSAALGQLLSHTGLPRSPEIGDLAIAAAWETRHDHRFNRGAEGRGRDRFRSAQMRRIEQIQFGHYGLIEWRGASTPME